MNQMNLKEKVENTRLVGWSRGEKILNLKSSGKSRKFILLNLGRVPQRHTENVPKVMNFRVFSVIFKVFAQNSGVQNVFPRIRPQIQVSEVQNTLNRNLALL